MRPVAHYDRLKLPFDGLKLLKNIKICLFLDFIYDLNFILCFCFGAVTKKELLGTDNFFKYLVTCSEINLYAFLNLVGDFR